MKIAFDQQTDYSGRETYSLLNGVELPEYVKTAEFEDASDFSGLPKAAFADADRRIYPINSPARVYISNAHFINKKADISKLYGEDYSSQIESRIKEAADVLGILSDLEEYNRECNIKQASDYDEQYMVDFHVDGMSAPVQLYPVKTAADLLASADSFAKNIQNFPFSVRIKSAENFVKAAAELGVDEIPDLLAKYAGLYYPDLENIQQELWRRSTKLASEVHKRVYQAIADDVSNMTSIDEVMKIAETCFNIENMEGLYEKRAAAQILGDPVDHFFTEPVAKVASALNYVEVHGDKYRMEDLTKVSKDKYEEAFGDCGIDPGSPEKIADILPTMPRSDVKLFEEISGVRPI
jgi:hypothetical protein